MGKIHLSKKPNLLRLPGILKPGIVAGKDMIAMVAGHFIQVLAAALGQDNGIGRLYG
jgi:hypothetical protein